MMLALRHTLILIGSGMISLTTTGICQSLKGRIVDQETHEPLPFSSVGIRHKNIGGVSDEKGTFSINFSSAQPADSLIIRYLGYHSVAYPVSKLDTSQFHVFELKRQDHILPIVEVTAKREPIYFGNKTNTFHGFTGWGGYDDILKGKQRGMLINVDGNTVRIQKVAMRIHDHSYDSALFRLHLYKAEGNSPGREILAENILFKSYKPKSWIVVDLTSYSLTIKENFFISVEWLKAWGARGNGNDKLTIAMVNEPGLFCHKEAPEDNWDVTSWDRSPALYVAGFFVGEQADVSRQQINERAGSNTSSKANNNRPTYIEGSQTKEQTTTDRASGKTSVNGTPLKKIGIDKTSKVSEGGNIKIEASSAHEFGTLIEGVDQPCSLLDFNFHVPFNDYESVTFLFNIYSIDKETGLPADPFFNNGISLKIGKEKGWIKKDLSSYHISLNENVIVTIKPIEAASKGNKPRNLFFTNYSPGTSFSRNGIGDNWTVNTNQAFSFFFTVK